MESYQREEVIIVVSLLMTIFISMEEEISKKDQWVTCGNSVVMVFRNWQKMLTMEYAGSQSKKKELLQEKYLTTNQRYSETKLSSMEACLVLMEYRKCLNLMSLRTHGLS